MMEYYFHTPYAFLILALIPAYLGGLWYQKKKRKAFFVSVFQDLQKSQKVTWRKWTSGIKPFLVVMIIALMAIVLARPQTPQDAVNIKKTGVDIFLVLDISESMLAEDLQPNRIQAAKKYIDTFLGKLENDRAGLIIYAGKPFVLSPLTFDYRMIQEYLAEVSTRSINQYVRGLNGTATGDALMLALTRFEKNEDRTNVIILLTDGDTNVGVDPVLVSEMAREKKVKIYAIGVGDQDGALIPVGFQNGQKIYARNHDGSLVTTSFNPEPLKKVADNTDGRMFLAQTNNILEYSFEVIQSLEKTELEAEKATQYRENYEPYLWALCSVFLFYVFLVFYFPIKQ